jgi:hypothetical protein
MPPLIFVFAITSVTLSRRSGNSVTIKVVTPSLLNVLLTPLMNLAFILQFHSSLVAKLTDAKDAFPPGIIDILVKNEILDIWIQDSPLSGRSTWNAVLYFYFAILDETKGCREQLFGSTGEFTDAVCNSNEEIGIAICEEEELCDHEVYADIPVTALKGEILTNEVLAAKVLCANVLGIAPKDCPDYKPFLEDVQGLTQFLSSPGVVPDQFENKLLSFGTRVPRNYRAFNNADPTRMIGIGDGALDIRAEIFDDNNMMVEYIKYNTFINLAAFIVSTQDNWDCSGLSTNTKEFRTRSLAGYLAQKYGSKIYDDFGTSFPAMLDVVVGENDCAMSFGSYYAWKCVSLAEFLAIIDEISLEGEYESIEEICVKFHALANRYKSITITGQRVLKYNIGDRCTNGCEDSQKRFTVAGTINGRKKTCDWAVSPKDPESATAVPRRCVKFPEVAINCPDTCKSCCTDASYRFYVPDAPFPSEKSCAWAKRLGGTTLSKRCKMTGVKEHCPITCLDEKCFLPSE